MSKDQQQAQDITGRKVWKRPTLKQANVKQTTKGGPGAGGDGGGRS